MLNTKSFLAVDFGAGSLKLAEFEINEVGGLRLKQYGLKSLGAEGSQETAREAVVLKALQEMVAEKGIKAKTVNVCAPGFHVFSKFVKLPPVDAGKVTQIIQYEAQQNVPFPLEEVVWDYQILGSTAGGELEVLLVAIKADIVEGLFRVTEAAGLSLQLCDVSPAALCNAFRFNYGDLEDCTMLLDIGAKTSNLLFFEKGKVFSRSINLGANSITQDFANESKKKFDAAEKIKIAEGFVSLGGAYEEPENQDQAAISKIARQFMTRLHIQVNQTMQFYRGQQGGSSPARLFLSGGASIMPYTAQFFAEKLNVPVEYFNPLRNVQIDPGINLEELARVAHSLGEVVGLGLRNLAHCPVELNLMPESTLKWQSFNQKKPYLIATAFSIAAVIAAIGLLFGKMADTKDDARTKVHGQVEPAQSSADRLKRALDNRARAQKEAEQVVTYMDDRFYWAGVLSAMRSSLINVQDNLNRKLGAPVGVWIDQLDTLQVQTDQGVDASATDTSGGSSVSAYAAAEEAFRRRYGLRSAGPPAEQAPQPAQPVAGAPGTGTTPKKANTANDIENMTITFRAVGLNSTDANGDKYIYYGVLDALQNNPLFDKSQTQGDGNIGTEEPLTGSAWPGTFTFKITVGLKRPLKL
jgi:type IV pilus assembly protein PilM